MRRILLVACLVLASEASRYKSDNKAATNHFEGQGQEYEPSYYYNRQTFRENNYPLDQTELQSGDSQFPSLINPNILLNGPSGLNKYKQYKQLLQQQQRPRISDDELKRLLVSIQKLEPTNNEAAEESAIDQQYNRLLNNARTFPLSTYYHLANQQLQQQQQQQQAKQRQHGPLAKLQIYQAESMIPEEDSTDEMELKKKSSSAEPEPVIEPKLRRKLTSGEPSMMQTSKNVVIGPKSYQHSIDPVAGKKDSLLNSLSDVYFVALVACVSSVAIFSVIGAGYCFYKVQQSNKAAADVDFPSYGVIGPASRTEEVKCASPPASDRKLTQSAQMYHYQHQKQQMISTEKNANLPRNNGNGSDIESDEENEDGEYTVYECPGLAPTGEMEIKNPLFQDDLTPLSSPPVKGDKAATGEEKAKN